MENEQTNQSVSESSDVIDFSEDTAETTQSNETTQPEATEQPSDFDLSYKYNGEEGHITDRQQAQELVQKGMNYDKVYGKLQELQNSKAIQTLNTVAERAGVTPEEYMSRIEQFQQKASINRIANDFKAKNPDATDEMANQYAETEYQNQELRKQQEQAQQAQQAQDVRQEMARQQVEDFMKEFPNVDVEHLPPEVIADIDEKGETLLSAYRGYAYRQAMKDNAALRQNKSNESKAVGSLSSNASSEAGGDAFLQGLLG